MSKGNMRSLILVSLMVITLLYVQNSCGQSGRRRGGRRQNGGRRGGMNPDLHRAYMQVLNQRQTTTTTLPVTTPTTPQALQGHNLNQFIPALPSADEIECYVEIMHTEIRGGRCTRAWGNTTRPYICQSGDQIELYPPCQYIVVARRAALLANGKK